MRGARSHGHDADRDAVRLTDDEREALVLALVKCPLTGAKWFDFRDEAVTAVERILTARESDLRARLARAEAQVAQAVAEGWRRGHDESCRIAGPHCSAHQPIDARARQSHMDAAVAAARAHPGGGQDD